MWLILTVCMLAVALVASMLGQGGGALYTPLQVWLGVEFHQAFRLREKLAAGRR